MVSLGEDFRPLSVEDAPIIEKYLNIAQYEESNHNLINLFLWRRYFPLWIYEDTDYALLLGIHKGQLFCYMPLCTPQLMETALLKARRLFNQYNIPFELSCVTEKEKDAVLKIFPEMIAINEPEASDYIYETEKLRTLSGKKLQKRRNNFNTFLKTYEGRYTYEALNQSNRDEAKDYLNSWSSEDVSEYANYERLGSIDILDLMDVLAYHGGIIRIDGTIKAFIIGSISSKRMAQINIEKADPSIRGLYQAIEKLFLEANFSEFTYINREDDMGIESLRRAKQALMPCCMIKKYRITAHETTTSQSY